jgi:hypothetical protein
VAETNKQPVINSFALKLFILYFPPDGMGAFQVSMANAVSTTNEGI